jgi:amino acid adenylation domain-containing protein
MSLRLLCFFVALTYRKRMQQMQDKIIEGFKLSVQQKHLWSLGSHSPVYRVQCAVELNGTLDEEAFAGALTQIALQHEILRTTFHRLDGMELPLQVIAEEPAIFYGTRDLRACAPEDQQREIEELFRQEGLHLFHLETGPLARFWLLRLANEKHVLLMHLCAMCADARTSRNIIHEIGRIYGTHVEDETAANNSVQYVDFAEWQRQLLEAGEDQAATEYWTRQNLSTQHSLTLPRERVAPALDRFEPETIRWQLEQDPSAIEEVARQHEVSLTTFMMACWQALLWRLTRQPDVVLNCLCDGRRLNPLRGSLGLFAQHLPISCHFENDYKFVELLQKLHDTTAAAYEHQEYYSPEALTFPAMQFEFDEWDAEDVSPNLRCAIVKQFVCIDRFKVKLSILRTGDALTAEFQYDPAFYSLEDMQRLPERFNRILQSALENPQARINELEILGEDERQQLLVKWNATRFEHPHLVPWHKMFEAQAEQIPDAIAVVYGDEQLSYGALNRRANQVAHRLRQFGCSYESRIGVLMERSVRNLEACLGVLKAGGVYVPLDPAQPPHRLELMLQETEVALLLTDQRLSTRLSSEAGTVLRLDADWQEFSQQSEENPGIDLSLSNGAYVIHTSGSTGNPKGALIEHGSLRNYALALRRLVYEDKQETRLRVSLNAPLAFDASIKQMSHLLDGHCLVIIPEDVRRDGNALLQFLEQQRLDVFDCTPTHLKMLRLAGFAERKWIAPRWILVGGEAVEETLWTALAQQQETEYFNHYGPSECAVNTTICRVDAAYARPLVGRPLINVQVFPLEENLLLAPIGAPGELYIAGAGLARGYINRADLTAEKFIPNPYSVEAGARMYKTGDLGRFCAGGELEFLGRADYQVKLRGNRIELGEIEAVLSKHPEVDQAVAVVRKDDGEGERLIAYAVLKSTLRAEAQSLLISPEQLIATALRENDNLAAYELEAAGFEQLSHLDQAASAFAPENVSSQLSAGRSGNGSLPKNGNGSLASHTLGELAIEEAAVSANELRVYLQEMLPEYMVPAAVVILPELPLTRNGKVDREALPPPDTIASEPEKGIIAPRTLIEEVLTGIWSTILQVEQVGVDENFFELGGHSLLATQLMSRIREAFQLELPLRSLFEGPTIAELAPQIALATSNGSAIPQAPPIQRVSRDGPMPLSFAQQRIWFLDQLEPGNPAYSSVRPVQLTGQLSAAALEQALSEIVRRHEILRTSFTQINGTPVQLISPPQPFSVPLVDLSGLPEEQREVLAQRLVTEQLKRPFDLTRIPLLRCALLRVEEQSHTVLFALHHIIIDGWAMSILVEELTRLYRVFSAGKGSPLPELQIQYADFAYWQRNWLREEVLEKQLTFWRQHLDNSPVLDLPVKHIRPASQTFNGAVQEVALPLQLSRELSELSRREGVTLYMTLLAAYKALLHLYSGQEDIVVGTGIASRNRVEIEQLIGFFINMLALRTDLSGNPSFRQLLKRVRDVALGAYAHQEVPFDRLVAELRMQWEDDRTSLFQVAFFLQNFPLSALDLPDLTLNPRGFDPGIAHFDLMLFMLDTPRGLIGGIEYNTDLFEPSTIAQMADHLQLIIQKIVANPEITLMELASFQAGEEEEELFIPDFQIDDSEQFNFSI